MTGMSPGDSALRTGSIWLAFVMGENALDSKMLYNFSCRWLGYKLVYGPGPEFIKLFSRPT